MCVLNQSAVLTRNDAINNEGVTTLVSLTLELLAKIVECCALAHEGEGRLVPKNGSSETQCGVGAYAKPISWWNEWKYAMPMWSVCRTTREALVMWIQSIQSIDFGGEAVDSIVHFPSIVKLWTNVHALNLSNCKGVDDRVVLAIVHYCPLLEILNVELCSDVTDASGIQIAQKCTMLTQIYMGACGVTDTTIVQLAHNDKKLTHVAIPLCAVTNDAVRQLANHCKLVALNIMKTERRKTSDAHGLPWSMCSELEHLHTRVTDKDMRRIANSCAKLTHFSCSMSYALTDAGIDALVAGTASLHHLDMSGCKKLTSVSVVSVARRYASLLLHLDLSFVSVNNVAIGAVASHCDNLTYLSLNSCKNVGGALKELHGRCLKLREVDLSATDVTNSSLMFFLYHFDLLTSEIEIGVSDRLQMETLLLSSCNITDAALVVVATSCPNLACLYVDMCERVTMKGIRTVLAGCKHLKHIWWTESAHEDVSVAEA